MIYLKLRNNIILDSDLQLAEREIFHIFGSVQRITRDNCSIVSFLSLEQTQSNIRKGDVIGYYVSHCHVDVHKLLLYLSFIQEIWSVDDEYWDVENPCCCARIKGVICAIPLMAMSEFLSYSHSDSENTMEEIVLALAGVQPSNKNIQKAIQRTLTSTPHVHSLHAYKAKFFPRFVRALIISNIDLNNANSAVCDPYVGSGTTLVESSLLGFPSMGIDIDPLSCFISKTKIDVLSGEESSESPKQRKCSEELNYHFPDIIWRKFQRWGTEDEGHEYEDMISKELSSITKKCGMQSTLHKISLSDALTRKFNIRMMGTGSGRFALEIAKTSLGSLIKSNLKCCQSASHTIASLKRVYDLEISRAQVINGDATRRSVKDKSVDIIVTSPPYIPASSGREDYLVGKIISLNAMKLLDNSFVTDFANKSVGAMDNLNDLSLDNLPQEVSDLYTWLINDELRSIKAKPIVSYYNSIRRSLEEDVRTLKDNGTIIYIIGKETVFYNSATKKIVYKVVCDSIFRKIAESVGLQVVEQIDIELDKKNVNARPRSTDKYYECAIVMKK